VSLRIFQRLDRYPRFEYSFPDYLRRILWEIVQRVFVLHSPRRAYGWRRLWLRAFGAQVHPTARVRPRVRIVHPWKLSIGAHSIIGDGVTVHNLGALGIGEHTLISQDVYLCGGTHDYMQENLPLRQSAITIGSGVWVCAGACIGPDVTVGDNSIVALRSVVTKDVEPGVIVGGNPARVLRARPLGDSHHSSPRHASAIINPAPPSATIPADKRIEGSDSASSASTAAVDHAIASVCNRDKPMD
jgi:putative colanic acid biosynthesis acetyltransferase WcaF